MKPSYLKSKNAKYILFIFFILLIVLLGVARISFPFVVHTAGVCAQNETTVLINKTVADVLSDIRIDYDEIAIITHDEDGRITSLRMNSERMNELKTKINAAIASQFRNIRTVDFCIPSGALLANGWTADMGPEIPVSAAFTCTVSSDLLNMYDTCGINQTIHRIVLNVRTQVELLFLGSENSFCVELPVTIAETVIVGMIPEIYSGSDDELWQNLIER